MRKSSAEERQIVDWDRPPALRPVVSTQVDRADLVFAWFLLGYEHAKP